jgi:hypothetical protein
MKPAAGITTGRDTTGVRPARRLRRPPRQSRNVPNSSAYRMSPRFVTIRERRSATRREAIINVTSVSFQPMKAPTRRAS